MIAADQRNQNVSLEAHYEDWVNTGTLVFDVTGVSRSTSRIDVFRVLLEYAEKMKGRNFSQVILASRRKSKFMIDGSYFQELGRDYDSENPIYTIRTFPTHVTTMKGGKPFSEYTGGILGVLSAEMEQFSEFSDQWYVNDFQSNTLAPAASPNADLETGFDPCSGIRDQDPHCGWSPHWDDSGVWTNPIDGARTEFLSMDSAGPDGEDGGTLHYAELRICFKNGKMCGGSDLGVGVAVDGMVAPIDAESEYTTAVRLRFDDEKPLRQTWGISDDHKALFPSGREREFLAELTEHKKLVLEFSYYEEAPRTVTFNLSGLAEKARADNLEISSGEPAGRRQQTKTQISTAADEARPKQMGAQITTAADEAGPKPTKQASSSFQCPRIETGTFVVSPGPAGHYWQFCTTGTNKICFPQEITEECFK